MTALLAASGTIRAALAALPRAVWPVLAALLVLWGGWRWHESRVRAAYAAGTSAQAALDRAAAALAAAAAARAQHDLAAALAARQSLISKGTADALARRHADLARRHDDLRLRWAAYRAGGGAAGPDRATALAGAAAHADDTACAAAGWVAFDTAAAAAHAADAAIAKDDAWIAWAAAQAAAWPTAQGPKAPG